MARKCENHVGCMQNDEHFPLQGMELILNSMGLVGTVTFVQHW